MSTGVMFAWYDYMLFVGILAISLAIGLGLGLARGRQRTTKEFLLANRKLGGFALPSQGNYCFSLNLLPMQRTEAFSCRKYSVKCSSGRKINLESLLTILLSKLIYL